VTSVLLFATTTGYQIRAFSHAARELGVELLFASDRCDQLEDPWWDQAIPVRFQHEDDSLRAVLAATRGGVPAAVLAVGDRPVPLAARVATALGLPGNPADAARRSRNKLASRQALTDAGLAVPGFRLLTLADDPVSFASELGYPVVLKPLALSGSRGVIRADDDRTLTDAFERLRRLLASPDVRLERDALHDRAMLETFIPGREYAIEGVLTNGALTVLAIFDKPDPLDGPFFEETIYVTPPDADAAAAGAIGETVAAAATALGLVHGPVHAEVRVNARGVFVLEVAARPIGGLCSRALAFEANGRPAISLESLLLRHALGEDISGWRRERRASGVMMMPIPSAGVFKGVAGVEEARAVAGVEDVIVTAKPDAVLVPLPEGRGYLGFIFARGETPREVERSLRDAHACLRFVIQRNLEVLSSATSAVR
jgi:biotin carboxylase